MTLDNWLGGLLSTPLVLPASVAGALAALVLVLAVMALRRGSGGLLQRLLVPVVMLVVLAWASLAMLDRLALNDRTAERRALLQRAAELSASALAPGSMLSCLDGGAGESVGNACEKAVFADAQSAASAVAYTAHRLTLLKDAAALAQGDPSLHDAFAATRRALELDRYGLVAHVLADRDGCTAEQCPAFALLQDTETLKANLKVRAYDTYVTRYAASWNKTEPKSEPSAAAEPPAAVPALAGAPPQAELAGRTPVSPKYDFPSAASIPPVSIMNAEPPLPKSAEAPKSEPAKTSVETDNVPVPPKRPQTQAATPQAR
jgi:hypothetical protein